MKKSNLSLSDQCYAHLKRAIVQWQLEPGMKFSEREFLERFPFSRTPLHQALARLSHDGLIEISPRSGYRVTPVTRDNLLATYDVWRVIGPLIARRAAERITPEDVTKLKGMRPPKKGRKLDAESVAELIFNAWEILANATKNDQLIHINRRCASEWQRIAFKLYATPDGMEWALRYSTFSQIDHILASPDLAAANATMAIEELRAALMELYPATE